MGAPRDTLIDTRRQKSRRVRARGLQESVAGSPDPAQTLLTVYLASKSMRKRVTFGPLICILALASMNALARGGHGGGGHGGGGHGSSSGGSHASGSGSHGSGRSRGTAAGSQSSGAVGASSAQVHPSLSISPATLHGSALLVCPGNPLPPGARCIPARTPFFGGGYSHRVYAPTSSVSAVIKPEGVRERPTY